MRLKTYSAPTLARAMELVRREMGDSAIIVSTQTGLDGKGARVTAALEDGASDDAPFGTRNDREKEELDTTDELRDALSFHCVPPAISDRLLEVAQNLGNDGSVLTLAGALDTLFSFKPLTDGNSARPLILVGPPGAGKTIVTAKLATRGRRAGRRPVVITTDTRRAGGIEQLQAFTRILGLELKSAPSPAALSEAVTTAADAGAFIDSAGVNPFNDIEMEELGEFVRAVGAKPIMVLAAGGDPMETADMAAGFAAIGARHVLMTRLDIARRLGSLIAAAAVPGISLSEVSINPHVSDGLCAINPVSLARLLLPDHAEPQAPSFAKEAAQ